MWGKECCIPKVRERIEAEEAGTAGYEQAAEAFVAFSLANGRDGKVEDAEGSLTIDIENAEERGLKYLADCAPKPVWWAAACALAEGRSVTLKCRRRDEEPFSC